MLTKTKKQLGKTKLEKAGKLHKTPTLKTEILSAKKLKNQSKKLAKFEKPKVLTLPSSIPGEVVRLLHLFYILLEQPKSQSQKESHRSAMELRKGTLV